MILFSNVAELDFRKKKQIWIMNNVIRPSSSVGYIFVMLKHFLMLLTSKTILK